jgi:adenylyltransferase/sulfurtransferase
MSLSEEQFHRYARHLILDEVGEEGQEELLNARVLVIGAGGLGSPVLMYLAAAGVGTLGVLDSDTVDVTNLQRQIVHADARIGASKVDSAIETLARLSPGTTFIAHRLRLDAGNVAALIEDYDVIADGSDNFDTRYLVNDACVAAGKTLVSASLLRFEGQLATFKPHEGGPCYRCLFPDKPPAGFIPRCEEAGILGSVAGVMGTLQATEVIKEILGLGNSLAGKLLIYDALGPTFRRINVPRDPDCKVCGSVLRIGAA